MIKMSNFLTGISLSPNKSGVLLEANDDINKYSLGGDTSSPDAASSTNPSGGDDTDSSDKYSLDNTDVNDTTDGDPTDNNDTTDNSDPSTDGTDGSTDSSSTDGTDPSTQDDNSSQTSTIPDIKILNLSQQDKQLNNLRLFRQFKELTANVANSIDIITGRSTSTVKQKQIFDVVLENLSTMKKELELIMINKFGDVYETNTTIYLTYLQRYKIAMQLLREAFDKLSDEA